MLPVTSMSTASHAAEPPATLAHPRHPVLAEIRRRRQVLRAGGSLDGLGTKLGLVVQGGGMRGLYSGAALVALEEAGLADVFDEVYGESAGATNASYFLAGQADFGMRIYLRDLANLRFINPLRIGRILDIDYLVDHVMRHVTPLDVGRVLRSRSRLLVSVTEAATARPRLIDVQQEEIPLLEVLRATTAAAPLYDRPVRLDDAHYVDGGLGNPIPIRSAFAAGCTHVLALLTVGSGKTVRPFGIPQRALLRPFLRSWSPALREQLLARRPVLYQEALDVAFGRADLPGGCELAVVGPPADAPAIGRTTLSSGRLTSAKERCVAAARALLDRALEGG